jgi:hypothetical protein
MKIVTIIVFLVVFFAACISMHILEPVSHRPSNSYIKYSIRSLYELDHVHFVGLHRKVESAGSSSHWQRSPSDQESMPLLAINQWPVRKAA